MMLQSPRQPSELEKINEVQDVDKKLQQVQQFSKLCATEAEEARKTEARCALEKQGLSSSLQRAQARDLLVCLIARVWITIL